METELPATVEASNHLISQPQDALAARDVIGLAKGILMANEALSEEEAFVTLVRASKRENRKLRDVAADVVAANAARATAHGREDDAFHGVDRGPVVVALHGEIDMNTRTAVDEGVQAALAAGARDLTLDMENVTFMDSQGLHVLLEAQAAVRARGGRLALRSASPAVRLVIELTALQSRLPIEQ